MKEPIEDFGLIQLIEQGGVVSDIPGATPLEVLTNLIKTVMLPPEISREVLVQAVLEREALMSTAVGHGIALPHPRNPIIANPQDQFVVIGFLRRQVDWKALDGKPVHTALLIVSSSAKLHLHTLSRINFFCQQESFRELLQNRVSRQRIIEVIQEAERAWK
jgi:PTS system nitrogen regulatory IIA component